MTEGSLWRTRVIWALLGAGLTAVVMRERGSEDRAAAAPVELARTQPLTPATPPEVVTPPLAIAAAPVVATPLDAGTNTTDPGTTDASTTDASPPDAGTTAAEVEPMEVPLPLLPGARVMSRGQRHDAERGGEILTLALSVPAPGSQVEAFYRRALTDAGMVVTGRSPTSGSIGAGHRSSLHGRGREATTDVNLKQAAGKLRTVVRIIWRTLP